MGNEFNTSYETRSHYTMIEDNKNEKYGDKLKLLSHNTIIY